MVRIRIFALVTPFQTPGERLLDVTIPQCALRGRGCRAEVDGISKRVNRWSPLTRVRDRTAAERPCWLPVVTRSQSRPTPFLLQLCPWFLRDPTWMADPGPQ